MKNVAQKVVIFSHGFGVFKDARGLFTHISEVLNKEKVKTILFDYDILDTNKKEVVASPFSKQAEKLQRVIDETYKSTKDAKITIVGHSQGCIIPTLCDLRHIASVINISPFFHTDMNQILKRYTSNPENEVNFTGISKRVRSDGTTTVIPPEYWKERFATDVVRLYNETALKTRLTLICALQDEIMKYTELKLIKYASIINTDGDHDFSKQYRPILTDIIVREV